MHNRNYNDIIHLKRPDSKRDNMKIEDRAAQFSPFAALTGHDKAIKETEKQVESKMEKK
ncbi:MAG: hypothetical protein GX287_07735 [Fusobacteria bacterium]|nr:hypothetical protein [Fusobacteriota bacterium]